jgi:putative endonuclease
MDRPDASRLPRSAGPHPRGEAPHLRLGRRGEKAAAHHLRRSGLKVLFANFAGAHGGELDLICREGALLVFVEVKTRQDERWSLAGDAVNADKRRRIIAGALEWLKLLGNPPVKFRFDIVEVVWPETSPRRPAAIRHLRDCFTLPADSPYRPDPPKPWRRNAAGGPEREGW